MAQLIETKQSFERMPPLGAGSASMRAAFWCGLKIKAAEAIALRSGKEGGSRMVCYQAE